MRGPLAIGPGDVLPGDEHAHVPLLGSYLAFGLARLMDHLIDFLARAIIGRHDQRAVGLPEILARDRVEALVAVGDGMHAALRVQLVDGAADLAAGELLDDGPECRIPLAHDDLEPGGLHARFLQLLVGTAGVERKLRCGREVAVHENDGIRKICKCPRAKWSKCAYPWHFSFAWKGEQHRFSLNRHLGRADLSKTEAERELSNCGLRFVRARFSLRSQR